MNSAVQLERILSATEGGSCRICQGDTQVTVDAIGRTRHRCPTCDGVARHIKFHPDEVLKPQTLVPASRLTGLPTIQPGQLRCQQCAEGVTHPARFCERCKAIRAGYQVKRCRGCMDPFKPTVQNRYYCVRCAESPQFTKGRDGHRDRVPKVRNRTPVTILRTRPCVTCGGPTPRVPGRPRKDCAACNPSAYTVPAA